MPIDYFFGWGNRYLIFTIIFKMATLGTKNVCYIVLRVSCMYKNNGPSSLSSKEKWVLLRLYIYRGLEKIANFPNERDFVVP